MNKLAVVSFSGGMDSSTLLLKLIAAKYSVKAVSFLYGQKHNIEIDRAKNLISFLQSKSYPISHHIINIGGLGELLHSSLIDGGSELENGSYDIDNMKDTVVPNRNKIFSSITQSIALSLSIKNNSDVIIGMGVHSGDHIVYPDCRKEFRDKDYDAFISGNWEEAERVKYYLPYIDMTKSEVLKDGLNICRDLNLDYRDVYSRTHTSYNVIKHDNKIYSDCMSSSSIERIQSFIDNNIEDPIGYADKSSPLNWEIVCDRISNISLSYKENQDSVC